MKIMLYTLKVFLISAILPTESVSRNTYPLYQAALRAQKDDLEFIAQDFYNHSMQKLKKILKAQKIEREILIYTSPEEIYYKDSAYEPFAHVLKCFPHSSAQLLASLLKNSLKATITTRQNNGWGMKEIGWLNEELTHLCNDFPETSNELPYFFPQKRWGKSFLANSI